MDAARIGPDMRRAAVAAPSYFATRKLPRVPQDLADHHCIHLRLPTSGGFYAREFEKAKRETRLGEHAHPSWKGESPAHVMPRSGSAPMA